MRQLHGDVDALARLRTSVGVPVGRPRLSPEAKAAVRRQLESGPFLAAIDAQVDLLDDIYKHDKHRIRLVAWEDF